MAATPAAFDVELCQLRRILNTSHADATIDQQGESFAKRGQTKVHLVAARCCELYEVVVLALEDHRLLVRYALRHAQESDCLTLVVPLKEADLRPVAAMDLSEEAEYLAVVAEDVSVLLIPLLDLMGLCVPAWENTISSNRPPKASTRVMSRERGTFDVVSELFGNFLSGDAGMDGFAARFQVLPSEGACGDVMSVLWWTHESDSSIGESRTAETEDGTGTVALSNAQYYLIIGCLSGQLLIVDIVSHEVVRTFDLSAIVWMHRCRDGNNEWLIVETAAAIKHWKLLLSTVVELPHQHESYVPQAWTIA
eukprot:3341599-Amphidinium_carterae.1